MPTTPTKGGQGGGGQLSSFYSTHPLEGAYLLDKKPTRGIPNHIPQGVWAPDPRRVTVTLSDRIQTVISFGE